MSVNITLARPYAKAIFHIANSNDTLNEWENLLFSLSIIIKQNNVEYFLKNKTISYDIKSEVMIELLESCHAVNKNMQKFYVNFIKVLSYYGRLLCIKEIYTLYKNFMNITLGRVEAVIKVVYALNNSQKEHIIDCLSKRINKKISALFVVDEKLLGGFLVKMGDFVLDASVVGNLTSLRTKIMV